MLGQAVMLLSVIWESSDDWDYESPEIFCHFLSHQTYVWIVPKITVQLFDFTYFPLHYTCYLIIQRYIDCVTDKSYK